MTLYIIYTMFTYLILPYWSCNWKKILKGGVVPKHYVLKFRVRKVTSQSGALQSIDYVSVPCDVP